MYLPGNDRTIPLVYEFGSLNTRIGYAGESIPQIINPTAIGTTESDEMVFLDQQFTKKFQQIQNIKNPIKNSVIEDIDIIEMIFQNSFEKQLQVNSSDHSVFICEAPIHSRESRIKIVEMLFEQFDVQGVLFHKAPVLSSYLFAKENMLLIDSGANYTYCVPIQDGYINQKALVKANIGGETLTDEFLATLLKRNVQIPIRLQNLNPTLTQWMQKEVIREIKNQQFSILEQRIDKLNFNDAVDKSVFELPDNQKLELSKEVYTIPEMLFQEKKEINFMGIQNMILQSVEKVDPDIRRDLLSNIYVVGGNSLLNNFIERLQKELFELDLQGLQNKVKVFTATGQIEKQHSSWIGGSIMASMPNYDSIAMTKQQFQEQGSILIERKCFE